MRRVMHRAKPVDESEKWVYGFYVYMEDIDHDNDEGTHRLYHMFVDKEASEYYEDYSEILPETLGEFTNLEDKKGNLIFEGDILSNGTLVGVVTWHRNGYFYLKEIAESEEETSFRPLGEMLEMYPFLVTGNIYDNKSLLKR